MGYCVSVCSACVVCYVYQTLLRACNVTYAHLCMDIHVCRKLATDSMNVCVVYWTIVFNKTFQLVAENAENV